MNSKDFFALFPKINKEYCARDFKTNPHGHEMIVCPICGKPQYPSNTQFERHWKQHFSGYLDQEGNINTKRNTKLRKQREVMARQYKRINEGKETILENKYDQIVDCIKKIQKLIK